MFFHVAPKRLFFRIIVGMRIEVFTPIQIAAVQGGNNDLGSSDVGGNGDVVLVAHPQKLHFVFADL